MTLQTLYLSFIVLSISGLLVSALVLLTNYRYRGAPQWTLGIASLVCGSTLIALRGQLPDTLTILVANILCLFAPALMAHSLRLFNDEAPSLYREYGPVLCFTAIFLLVAGDLQGRLVIISVAYGCLALLAALAAWRIRKTVAGRGPDLLALTFLIVSLLSFARAAISATTDLSDQSYLALRGYHGYYLLAGSALWFCLLTGFILLVNGRLEQELRTESLRLQAANDTKNKLFTLIGHDLRGSVGSLTLSLEMINEELESEDIPHSPRCKATQDLARVAERQARLTKDVLHNMFAWARAQQGALEYRPRPVHLGGLLRDPVDFLTPFGREKGVTMVTEDSVLWIDLFVDEDSTAAIFRNLIANAIKYSHPGGRIVIDADLRGDEAVIRINDEGTGIPSERLREIQAEQKVISHPGTRHETGTGMGLQLCFEYARGNHGRIEFESRPGAGTTAIVTLPAARGSRLTA